MSCTCIYMYTLLPLIGYFIMGIENRKLHLYFVPFGKGYQIIRGADIFILVYAGFQQQGQGKRCMKGGRQGGREGGVEEYPTQQQHIVKNNDYICHKHCKQIKPYYWSQ